MPQIFCYHHAMEAKRGKRDKAKPYVSLEMEEKKDENVKEGRERAEPNPDAGEEPLEDDFDHLFWLKVCVVIVRYIYLTEVGTVYGFSET